MKNILIHGLGQNSKDWDTIKNELETRGISPIVPDLFDLTKGRELDYPTVYQAFSELCESYKDKLNLCGLSLGGLLALNYAIQYPRKINSLVLIGTPFEIPKGLLKFQNIVFRFMPKAAFQNMGVSKKDFIRLSNSMTNLNFMELVATLGCPALILCGAKDKTNMESAKRFHEAMKNSKLVIVDDSGHEVNKDNPNELVSILQDFWAER
ncbi:MAG TPA: alpha/beta hydrolase [Oscillospiraceae bacterium]|jgi:pimeloyl-ACP methyl ester carboxylesterase|nr:alpha/beta hydrolase [Oscillospiraceae bacterium]